MVVIIRCGKMPLELFMKSVHFILVYEKCSFMGLHARKIEAEFWTRAKHGLKALKPGKYFRTKVKKC